VPQSSERIVKLQAALKAEGLTALLLEPGPAMLYLTGVRWGRSERLFAALIPQSGEPAWVLPAFEETRARELLPAGARIRVWQEDENPFAKIVDILGPDRAAGRLGVEATVRFFVFDGIRRQMPGWQYVSAAEALKATGLPDKG
jgi:Xaa-Pro aminopeptidase